MTVPISSHEHEVDFFTEDKQSSSMQKTTGLHTNKEEEHDSIWMSTGEKEVHRINMVDYTTAPNVAKNNFEAMNIVS